MTLRQASGDLETIRYRIEPGDGTRYEFMISWYVSPSVEIVDLERTGANGLRVSGRDNGQIYDICGGIDGGYVTLSICMPSYSGSYELHIRSLSNPDGPLVHYFMGHMSGTPYVPTIVAIVLAASVLVQEPDDLVNAARAASQWREFMDKEGIDVAY